jgi:hypothetical protein
MPPRLGDALHIGAPNVLLALPIPHLVGIGLQEVLEGGIRVPQDGNRGTILSPANRQAAHCQQAENQIFSHDIKELSYTQIFLITHKVTAWRRNIQIFFRIFARKLTNFLYLIIYREHHE